MLLNGIVSNSTHTCHKAVRSEMKAAFVNLSSVEAHSYVTMTLLWSPPTPE